MRALLRKLFPPRKVKWAKIWLTNANGDRYHIEGDLHRVGHREWYITPSRPLNAGERIVTTEFGPMAKGFKVSIPYSPPEA